MSDNKKTFQEASAALAEVKESVGELKSDVKDLQVMFQQAEETVKAAYTSAKEMVDLDPDGNISIDEYIAFCEDHIKADKVPQGSAETLRYYRQATTLLQEQQGVMRNLDKKVKSQKKNMRAGRLSDKDFESFYTLRRDYQYAGGIEAGLVYRLGCAAKVLFHEIKHALGAEAGH